LSDATQLYLHQIGLKRLLTPERGAALRARAVAGDFAARQKMIEHNLRLVVNVAKAYLNRAYRCSTWWRGQSGTDSRAREVRPERGFRFSLTYAIWWIRRTSSAPS